MEQQAFDAEAIKSESNEVSWTKKNDKQLIFHLIEEMKSQTTELGGCRGKKKIELLCWFILQGDLFIIYLNSNISIIFIKKIQNYCFKKKKKKKTTSRKW